MKLAIMQPYLFPYIGYWQLIGCVDKFVVYDDVNYIVRGWINRNNILVQGEPRLLTLSLSKPSRNKLINEIEIAEGAKREFLHQIECNYRKAPQFPQVFPLLESILGNPENNIAKFIRASLESVSRYLHLETEFLMSSEIPKDNSLRGDDKIAHICGLLGAETYINPYGGMEIYHEEKFLSKNIRLLFLKPRLEMIHYEQFRNEFANGLSIVDLMMFNEADVIHRKFLPLFQLIRKSDPEQ